MKSSGLFALLKKDFIIFFRHKLSAILIILIPLIIIIAAGYAYDTSNLSNIYVGVHLNSSSALSEKIVKSFGDNGFLVKNYSSQNDCVDSVKMDAVQICAIFANDSIENSTRGSVTFYVDYSKINLANTLVNGAEGSVYNESNTQGKGYVQDLINLIDSVKEELPGIKTNLGVVFSEANNNKISLGEVSIPITQFNSALDYLNSAKASSNDSVVQGKIANAISLISLLKQENENVSGVLGNVLSSQNEVVNNLSVSLDDINSLNAKVSSKSITSAQDIISPMKIDIEPINTNSKSRDYIIPVLISLILMFGALLLSSTLILKEKKTIAYFRNFMTPTRSFTFVFSTYLTCLLILIFQFVLVFLGIKFILGMGLVISLELIVTMLLGFSAFIFIGMFIGYLFRSEESVIFASMIVAGVFLFFSNIILPVQNISLGLMEISLFNPMVVLDSALKKIMLFGLGFGEIGTELIYLGGFTVVFLFLSYLLRKLTKRVL